MWLDTLAEGPLRTQKIVPQSIAWFALSLGVLALLLATVGLYGVVSYTVGGSTHEIGVRMALGATKSDVLRWAVRQKARPVVLGGVAGLAFSLAVSTLLRAALAVPGNPDLLFGASPFAGATFAGAFALLGGLALIACYIPARRAAKVDPMVALRHE